ncbi:hypothetical protein J6590_079836 [Homalodisca vitripennis]|nr:hypothetical protein J6590_094999 [Homalodisca vitripennis]KAG8241762.1 hypothetical protein J6590_079836 [Homalodisca vitripennis]
MSDKCSKCKVDFVISREGIKCTECGELYHLRFLTVEQGKKATRKNWKCGVCACETSSTSSRAGEGGQSTVLQAIATFRAELSWRIFSNTQGKIIFSYPVYLSHKKRVHHIYIPYSTDLQMSYMWSSCDRIYLWHIDFKAGVVTPGRYLLLYLSFRGQLKAMWMSAARERKGLLACDIHSSFPPDSKVFIYEHLATQTRQLFNGAKKLVRQRVLSVAWTYDGRVLAKSTPGGATFRIQHQDQLDQMKRRIMELTTQEAGGQAITRTDTVPVAAT